ncbi:putative multidrug resistance protein MdtD [wastewater metagenome]|uniref:MFS-type drug efflux transporter P55 n=2 Tax=unclassified sequences TaxID=12908 RepID=A0A5B8RGN4_9ZZZZ|nr:putative multidrug resistance protein MdtD [uncultured organism]
MTQSSDNPSPDRGAAAARAGHVSTARRGWVLACVMLTMFLAAIEGTIVATAMPDIVSSLGGVSLYTWVFSGFFLAQAVATPLAGKLADLFGRRPLILGGVAVFLAASLACGLATSMPALVACRLVQGAGAGAVQPIAMTLVGDLYTLSERGRIQGWLSSTWGISALLGPLVGGAIVDHGHWPWIFWLHLPFGVLAMVGLAVFLRERPVHRHDGVDYPGAGWFLLGCSTLMLLLVQGGVAFAWDSAAAFGLAATAAVGGAAFLRRERRAPEPLMDFGLWRYPLIRIANGAALTAGMMIIGLTSFLPAYVQGVLGTSATVAGFALTAVSVGWPVAAVICGRMLPHVGPRVTARIGGVCLCLGGVLFVSPGMALGAWWPALGSFATGLGMGFTNTTFVVSIQSVVGYRQRGAATAGNLFMRLFGSALGAAVLGGVLNQRLQSGLSGSSADLNEVRGLLGRGGEAMASLAPSLQAALADALGWVFAGVLLFGVLTAVQSFRLPALAPGHAGERR